MSNGSVGTSSLFLIAAATAAAAATTMVYASAFGMSNHGGSRSKGNSGVKHQHFNVPSEILQGDCECREEVILAVRLALEGG